MEHNSQTGAAKRDGLVLFLGVFACSTSVLFIKGSALHPVTLACGRLLVAVVLLSPLFVRDLRRHAQAVPGVLRAAVVPGLLLGIHLIAWNAGAQRTSAANASLVVNMVPLVTPAMLLALTGERLSRGEWRGTALGSAGVVLLAVRDYQLAPALLWGDALCFVAMLLFALYLVLARRNREVPSVFLYVVPLYAVAALTCAGAMPFVSAPLSHIAEVKELWLVIGLGAVPTVLGHSALNFAMTRLRGQLVTISNLGQPIFAGVMAYALLSEVPTPEFYAACVLIIAGAIQALGGFQAIVPRLRLGATRQPR